MPSNLGELYLHKNITGGRAMDENRWEKSGLELNVPFFSFSSLSRRVKGFCGVLPGRSGIFTVVWEGLVDLYFCTVLR